MTSPTTTSKVSSPMAIALLDHYPCQVKFGLGKWLMWVARPQIQVMVMPSRNICRHKVRMLEAFEHGLSNGRTESVNTKIPLLT